MSGYCDFAPNHPIHGSYHDTEYGFPVTDDRVLFERLALEIMQAGLSWEIVLKKRKALNRLFDRFDPKKVAAYTSRDVARILKDEEGIRNKLKILAIIHNANRILELKKEQGSFSAWLDANHPLSKEGWVKLFKKSFKFTGGEILGEFLMSTGYLPGAHRADCPVFKAIKAQKPPFLRDVKSGQAP